MLLLYSITTAPQEVSGVYYSYEYDEYTATHYEPKYVVSLLVRLVDYGGPYDNIERKDSEV